MSKSRKLYLVVRRTWDGVYPNYEERVPVRGFAAKKDAEAYRRQLDAEFRRDRDPWAWFAETRAFEEQLAALKAVAVGQGLIKPKAEEYGWWRSLKAPLTPEQRAAFWAVLPDCKAYEVIETKLLD
ncbi:MAG: hypothetical protein K2V38_27700 [Gemmataceae bacterium]|nr:hypothetical protein [Gemmataceae bacterium]